MRVTADTLRELFGYMLSMTVVEVTFTSDCDQYASGVYHGLITRVGFHDIYLNGGGYEGFIAACPYWNLVSIVAHRPAALKRSKGAT